MLETYRNLTTIGYIWEEHNSKEHCQRSRRHERIERNNSGKKLSVHPQSVKALAYDSQLHRNKRTHDTENESNLCYKAFAHHNSLQMHKGHILKRIPVNVISVVKPLYSPVIFNCIN